MSLIFTSGGHTDVGRVREGNEDNLSLDDEAQLWIVADGMGGHAAGEVAAQIVVEVLPRILQEQGEKTPQMPPAEILRAAIIETSRRVFRAAQNSDFSGMGATVVVLWHPEANDSWALIGHLGDSRAYLWREHILTPLTRDHSLVELLVESGDLSPEAARTHPARNQITQCCGLDEDAQPGIREMELQDGDRIMLCSDGVNSELTDDEIAALCAHGDAQEAAEAIVFAAVKKGGHDNATAIVVEVKNGHARAND